MSKPEVALLGLVKRFRAHQAAGVSAVYQLNLTGDEGGQWYLAVADGRCELTRGLAPRADVTITMAASDWVDLLSDRLDGYTAFMEGRIEVEGDLGVALQLQQLFGF